MNKRLLLFIILFITSCGLFLWARQSITLLQLIKMDSLGHFIGFFILSWILYQGVKLPIFITILSLIFYAALTELGQYYLGFRRGELRDVYSDALGVVSFFTLIILHRKYYLPNKNSINTNLISEPCKSRVND